LVVVGGAAIAPAFVLLVLPVLIDVFGRGAVWRRTPSAARQALEGPAAS
jgi:hypothetical protein